MKSKYLIIFIPCLLLANTILLAADTLYDNRFKSWQEKAQSGDSFSQYSLGNAYLRGNEVSIDMKKALQWFKKAAKNDHAKSQYKLGYLYYTGKGVRRNYKTAFEWFMKAAEHDYSPAQFYLGRMYASGKGITRNSTKALKWLNDALKNDYSPAKREIARIQKEQNNSAPVKPVIKVTVKKPKPIKKQIIKTTIIKKSGEKSFDVAALLLRGRWILDNNPSEILPSMLTLCTSDSTGISCKTDELSKSTIYAEVSYIRESTITRLTNNGRFIIDARKNVLFVLPADPDDPDVEPDTIPGVGWSLPQRLICKFQGKHKIKCSTDDYQKITFIRDI